MTTNYSYTLNYNFSIPRYDTQLWHGAMKDNLKLIDALIAALGLPVVSGIWQNSTSYAVGARAFDTSNSTIYEAQVAHTSASSGTFLADRTANPTYWTAVTAVITWRGAWAASTQYYVRDVVREGHIYYQANTAHVSSASFATDAANWETVVDLSTSVDAAAASATAAASSETNAATSETNAASSASAASTSETNAANSASAASTSATGAASSASAASTSATNAATSSTNAATSATNAATSATNAATSETNAAASYDSFDDRYLGAKASDPTLDNDGDPLIEGALYWNTTTQTMRVRGSSSWTDVSTVTSLNDYTATGDGSTAAFNTGLTLPSDNNTFVWLDGVRQYPTTDYTTSGTTITFTSAPSDGRKILVIPLNAVDIGTPSDDTVGPDQLDDTQIPEIRGFLDLDLLRAGNLIINGNFEHNQRDSSSYSSAGYSLDRWKVAPGSGSTNNWSQNERASGASSRYEMVWARSVAGSAASFMSQRIEDVHSAQGQKITVEVTVSTTANTEIDVYFIQLMGSGGSPSSNVNPAGGEQTINVTTGAEQTVTLVYDIPTISGKTLGTNNDHALELVFRRDHDATNPTAAVSIRNVAIVYGDASNEDKVFRARQKQQEFDLCRRYYQRMTGRGNPVFSNNTTQFRTQIAFNPNLRATPTITLLVSAPSIILPQSTISGSSSSLVASSGDAKGARMVVDGFTGLTAGTPGQFNQSADPFEFDAEL